MVCCFGFFLSRVLMRSGWYKNYLSFRMKKRNFLNPHTTASNSCSPMEYYVLLSLKYRLPYVIDFVFPSSCLCHNVIPSPVMLASALLCFLYLSHSVQDMGLWVTFVLFSRSFRLVRFFASFRSVSVVFGVCQSFPRVSVGFLPCIG